MQQGGFIKSVDINTKKATAAIAEMHSAEIINAFIEGDSRKTVLDAAAARISSLTPKQGEVDRITQEAADFKEGIQRTKDADASRSYVTGEDVLRNLREKGIKG